MITKRKIDAKTKRRPAPVKGGIPSREILMACQVVPQIRQRAISPIICLAGFNFFFSFELGLFQLTLRLNKSVTSMDLPEINKNARYHEKIIKSISIRFIR